MVYQNFIQIVGVRRMALLADSLKIVPVELEGALEELVVDS